MGKFTPGLLSWAIGVIHKTPAPYNGCAMCVAVCLHAVIQMDERKAALIRPSACMECSACHKNYYMYVIKVESGVGCAEAKIRAALTCSN